MNKLLQMICLEHVVLIKVVITLHFEYNKYIVLRILKAVVEIWQPMLVDQILMFLEPKKLNAL